MLMTLSTLHEDTKNHQARELCEAFPLICASDRDHKRASSQAPQSPQVLNDALLHQIDRFPNQMCSCKILASACPVAQHLSQSGCRGTHNKKFSSIAIEAPFTQSSHPLLADTNLRTSVLLKQTPL